MEQDRTSTAAGHQLQLLLQLAPLAPELRREARRALAARDPAAIRAAGRRLIRHLRQEGRLQPVVAPPEAAGSFVLAGHTGVLRLDALLSHPVPSPAATLPPSSSRGHGWLLAGTAELDRLLQAMESAQQLPVQMESSAGNPDVVARLLSLLRPCFPHLGLAVLWLDPEDDQPGPEAAAHGVWRVPVGPQRPFWLRRRVPGEACFLTSLLDVPPAVRRWFDTAAGGEAMTPVAAVPLYHPDPTPPEDTGGREVGLFLVGGAGGEDRDSLIRLGARLARFVTSGWRQQRRLSLLVHTDALTGLRNRGFFDQQFPLELERARRRDMPLVLLLGDIDHFKSVNDTHGHPVGDHVLKAVARELQQALRRIDLVCRAGGEEFALVLPDTDREAAREVVSRLLVRVANLRQVLPGAGVPLRVTMSFGGVAFPEGGEDAAALYRRADEMLYLSKQRGRNRCHLWKPDGKPQLLVPDYRAPRPPAP